MWKHDARRAECFHTISSFSNFSPGPVKDFVCVSFTPDNLNCFRVNKMAYLPKPESGTKRSKTSTRRNKPLVRTTTSESLEIHLF